MKANRLEKITSRSKARLSLLALLLLFGSISTELSAQEEAPTYWERFVAIFKPPPAPNVDTLSQAAVPLTEEQSITQRYARIYNLIHQEESKKYQRLADSSFTNWEDLQDLKRNAKYVGKGGDTVVLAKNINVFGWHPHWMGDAYQFYNYNLLSHISLFAYNVNVGNEGAPYDNPEVVETWTEDYALIPMAQEAGCKVLITITNFGERNNRKFLDDTTRQDALIENVINLLGAIKADGVDVDFENIPSGYEKAFSSFIRQLRNRLNSSKADSPDKSDYLLSVVLPKINQPPLGYKIYNIDTLQQYVDLFVLTGYDFITGVNRPGPIAPLYTRDGKRGKHNSIEDVVFNYLEEGLDRQKLLLGLPMYGGRWTQLSGPGVEDTTIFEHLTYSNVKRDYARYGPPKHDTKRWGALYEVEREANFAPYTQASETTWFDDSLTMSVKYDWVLEQGLGGIGIWALGYDNPFPEMWGLIDDKFAPVNDTLVYYQVNPQELNLPALIMQYRNPIAITGLFVFIFLALGFVVAIFDWRVRAVFFKQRTLRLLYIAAAFAVISAAFSILLYLQPRLMEQFSTGTLITLSLVLGLVLGAVLLYVINARFTSKRSEIP